MSKLDNNISERVRAVIADQMKLDLEKIKPEASFTEDLGADSLTNVEMVMALEEKFEIDIPDEDSQKIATVNDAIRYVESKISKKVPA